MSRSHSPSHKMNRSQSQSTVVTVNTTDPAVHVGEELNAMTAEEEDEYIEQLAAQIACLTVKLPEAWIMEACKKAYVALLVPPKSKYEYNNERKRDIPKVCRASIEMVAAVSTEIEKSNQSVYGQLYADPSLYIRHYKLKAFNKLIKDIDIRHTTFERIQKIDLADQQIGDQGLVALCNGLRSSPVESISLVNCDITDDGLCDSLSQVLRALFELKELYLNQNKFGDRGIESLFRDDTYSRSLRLINISRNAFTSKSALYIGSMFVVPVQAEPPPAVDAVGSPTSPTTASVQAAMAAAVSAVSAAPSSVDNGNSSEAALSPVPAPVSVASIEKSARVCNLEAVFAGGITINRTGGEGDRFVRTLCGQLMTPNARPIKELHVPDMALGDSNGLRSLAALIAVSPGLRTVNIARNAITTPTTKTFFYLALMLNKDLENLMMGQCGLEYSDLKSFELLKKKNRELRSKQQEAERAASAEATPNGGVGGGVQRDNNGSGVDRYRPNSVSESLAGSTVAGANDSVPGSAVVNFGNVLTWHEKVTGGLMIAKEASTNEQMRYKLNLELYNLWRAVKPIVTPSRISSPYQAYKDIMRAKRLSCDPLAYLIKPTQHVDTGSKPSTAASSRPLSPLMSTGIAPAGAVVVSGGTDVDGKPAMLNSVEEEDEEIPVDNSAEMKFLPQDVEVSLRCALIFSDYIGMFLEPDRQVALTFIRPLTEEEITAYREQLGADTAAAEEAVAIKKARRLERARKRASEEHVPQISSRLAAGTGGSAQNTARRGSNSSVGSVMSVHSDSVGSSSSYGGNISAKASSLQLIIPGEIGSGQFIIPYNRSAVSILGKNELVLTQHMESYLQLKEAAEKRIEKRRANSSFARLFMTVCVDKYVTTMKNRSTRNPGKVRAGANAAKVSGWASKSSRKTAAMTPGLVSMAIEDYHASLMELSTETEQSMALIHKAFITCLQSGSKAPAKTVKSKKSSIRGNSIKVRSDAGILNASNRLAINDLFNYKTLDLAGYYVACVCHAVPRERERAIEAGKKEIEDAKVNVILEARQEAKTASKATTFKIGPRFQIFTRKNPRPVETAEDLRHLAEINAHHKVPRHSVANLIAPVEKRSESTRFGLFNAVMSTKTAAFFRRFNEGSEKVSNLNDDDRNEEEEQKRGTAVGDDGDGDDKGSGVDKDNIGTEKDDDGGDGAVLDGMFYEAMLLQSEAGLGLAVGPSGPIHGRQQEQQQQQHCVVKKIVTTGTTGGGSTTAAGNGSTGLQIQQIDAEAGGEINVGDVLVGIVGEDCRDWSTERVAARLTRNSVPVGTTVVLKFCRPATTGAVTGVEPDIKIDAAANGTAALTLNYVMLGAPDPVPMGSFSPKGSDLASSHVLDDDVVGIESGAGEIEGTNSHHHKHHRKHKHKHKHGNKHQNDANASDDPVSALVPLSVSGSSGASSSSTTRPPSAVAVAVTGDGVRHIRSAVEILFQIAHYKSKYFKIPTIYKRPHNNAGYENASTDELHFLCSESLDGLAVAQSRSNRRFLISIHPNTIWSRHSKAVAAMMVHEMADAMESKDKENDGISRVASSSSESGVGSAAISRLDSAAVMVVDSVEGTIGKRQGGQSHGRTRTSSAAAGSAGSMMLPSPIPMMGVAGSATTPDPSVYNRVKARTNSSFWHVEPQPQSEQQAGSQTGVAGGQQPNRLSLTTPSSSNTTTTVAVAVAAAPASSCVYAEVECIRSEPIGSIEHMNIWRLKVQNDQRKRLQQEKRMKFHEEMLK